MLYVVVLAKTFKALLFEKVLLLSDFSIYLA